MSNTMRWLTKEYMYHIILYKLKYRAKRVVPKKHEDIMICNANGS